MQWEILIIPLIALGVWILGTLFKNEDDKTKRGVVRRGNVSSRATGRRVVTDLDRFLEEARRRREPEPRRQAPPPPRPPARERPPVRERPPQRRETPRPSAPLIVKEEVLVALPAPRPVEPAPVAEVVAAKPLARAAALSMPAPAAATRPSPITQQMRSLLSKPQTAATAFVLREIFDRPLCKRRR